MPVRGHPGQFGAHRARPGQSPSTPALAMRHRLMFTQCAPARFCGAIFWLSYGSGKAAGSSLGTHPFDPSPTLPPSFHDRTHVLQCSHHRPVGRWLAETGDTDMSNSKVDETRRYHAPIAAPQAGPVDLLHQRGVRRRPGQRAILPSVRQGNRIWQR